MIIVDNSRILLPDDLLNLILQIRNLESQINFLYLFSGIRPSEANFILDNPTSIDYERRIINFTDNRWDKARRFKSRQIYLSRWDLINVSNFIKINKRMNTKSYQINRNLKYWADKANIDIIHMDSQTMRLTRLAWLLHLFPTHTEKVITSMDFYGDVEIYKNLNFSLNDKLGMLCYLGDWSGAITYNNA